MSVSELAAGDADVRIFVYRFWVVNGRPPTAGDVAAAFRLSESAAVAALRRLQARHALLLEADGRSIRIANPLSAVPTPYRVLADGRWLIANCAWDALGIPAMLHADAHVEATVAQTDEPVACDVIDGRLVAERAVVHFSLPLRRWYDDLIHT
jgi:hypothetical protein